MASMLETLIPELLDQVLSLLGLSDLRSVRLASSLLEERSRGAFGAAAFSNITIDLTSGSLQWMSDIASTEHRFAVRNLEVWDDASLGSRSSYSLGTPGPWPRLESGTLDTDSHVARKFVDALCHLPNCTSATVADTKQTTPHPSIEEPSSADAVELVLHAYSAPGAPPIRCFRLRSPTGRGWWARPVAISKTTVAAVQSAFAAHLQELVLDLAVDGLTGPYGEYMSRLLDLLTAAASVRTLRLVWNGANGHRQRRYPWSREGYALNQLGRHLDSFPDFAPPLEDLTLAEMELSQEDLLRLLSAYQATLTSLSLYDVHLKSGYWEDILDFIRDGPFRRLHRIAVHGAFYGEDTFLAFCPLWKAWEGMRELCGGTFDFWTMPSPLFRTQVHVMGVVFEAGGGAQAMEMGLRAMVEYSHRRWRDHGGPRGDMCEVAGFSFGHQWFKDQPAVNRAYERLTGLPVMLG